MQIAKNDIKMQYQAQMYGINRIVQANANNFTINRLKLKERLNHLTTYMPSSTVWDWWKETNINMDSWSSVKFHIIFTIKKTKKFDHWNSET